MTNSRFSSRSPRNRSGMALMLVIPAVAVAAVLAYAVLANTGTQDQISANSALLSKTDCFAESGINYAIYNLQNPQNSPTPTASYWVGTTSPLSLGGSSGTVTISVQPYGPGEYNITSVANAAAPSNISRTMYAVVQLTIPVGQSNQAAGFNGNLSLGSSTALKVVGNLITSGTATLNSLSSVQGTILQNASAPAATSVNSLTSYMYNGSTYPAQMITVSPAAGTVLQPSAVNPAGIFYYTGTALTLNGITVNGTLYALNATVTVSGSSTNTINAQPDFPGLIASKITVSSAGKQLTVNGVVYAKSGITGNGGTGSGITINGALMIPASPAIATTFAGTITLNYVAKNVNVPNFSPTGQTPTSVKVVNWSQP